MKKNFIDMNVLAYSEACTTRESGVLHKVSRTTEAIPYLAQMMAGNLQGQFLRLLSKLIKPLNILEVGTCTGYSAICLAEGLQEEGKLITIEYNTELEQTIRGGIEEAGYADKIKLILGDAIKVIPDLDEMFDLIFIDADKKNYLPYYKMLLPKLSQGGIMLVDNVLWEGKVADESITDNVTVSMRAFNEFVKKDNSTEKVMLPLRDGLYLIRKVDG